MVTEALKRLLPREAVSLVGRARKRWRKARLASLPRWSEEEFRALLTDELWLAPGDVVFIHSSVEQLRLSFPYGRVLALVREVIGERGTVLLPTYPGLPSYEFLARGEVFDVRRTPSFMGLLTEYARRQRGAVRSLHPTKSVCAIGPLARELTATHQLSPYPFDRPSPYHKLVECGGKVVGLGVSTERLSLVHCVEDALGAAFPVRTYHPQLFAARCINYAGQVETVNTYAHDLGKMNHHIPRFVRAHLSAAACRDLRRQGAPFYRADAARLFSEMLALARRGVTIYPRKLRDK